MTGRQGFECFPDVVHSVEIATRNYLPGNWAARGIVAEFCIVSGAVPWRLDLHSPDNSLFESYYLLPLPFPMLAVLLMTETVTLETLIIDLSVLHAEFTLISTIYPSPMARGKESHCTLHPTAHFECSSAHATPRMHKKWVPDPRDDPQSEMNRL